VPHPLHRDVHFWRTDLIQPPCEPLEDRFEWSDDVADVTCVACKQALAGDAGELSPAAGRSGVGDGEPRHPAG
jgi:hypothetical protein